ncbi:hypothetical protein DMENIID0001_110340 [Sergentomyia squamirostris]
MVWMKRILTHETTDYCKSSTLAPVLPQANHPISSTSMALGSAIVISSSSGSTSAGSRTTSPLLFQPPPPPTLLLHNHRSTIEEVASSMNPLKSCLATIRCSVASPLIYQPPQITFPSPLNRCEPPTITPFYHHPRRFPRFQTLLGERVASSSAISTGNLLFSTSDVALGKAQQQQDFLSLSLSPPLNRRRDMPALRGPFVSL